MNIGITLTSSLYVGQEYIDLTESLARKIAMKKHGIVYGGTDYGMMSKLAEAYKSAQGRHLVGVMAEDLILATKNYQKYKSLDEEYVVPTMEDRKKKIISLSDAYIILPGGYGTFEEIGSIIGGQANKLYSKPIAFFNYKGYYNSLLNFFEEMYTKKFSKLSANDLCLVSDDLDKIFDFFTNYEKKNLVDKFV